MLKFRRESVKKATQPCYCCSDLIDELKMKKCSGCSNRVCKKCAGSQLCHVCKVKTNPSTNNEIELKKMKKDKLMQIMKNLHFDKAKYKSLTVDELALEIIGRMTKELPNRRGSAVVTNIEDIQKGQLEENTSPVNGTNGKSEDHEDGLADTLDLAMPPKEVEVVVEEAEAAVEEAEEAVEEELQHQEEELEEEVAVEAIALEEIRDEDHIWILSEGQLKAVLKTQGNGDNIVADRQELVEEVTRLWKASRLSNGHEEPQIEEVSVPTEDEHQNGLEEEEEKKVSDDEDTIKGHNESDVEDNDEMTNGTKNVSHEQEEEEEKGEEQEEQLQNIPYERNDDEFPEDSSKEESPEMGNDFQESPKADHIIDNQYDDHSDVHNIDHSDVHEPVSESVYEERETEQENTIMANGHHNEESEASPEPENGLSSGPEVIILDQEPPLVLKSLRKQLPQLQIYQKEVEANDHSPKTPGVSDKRSLPFEIRITDESYMGGPEDRTSMTKYLKTLEDSQVDEMQEFLLRAVLRSFSDCRKDLWKREDLVQEVKKKLRQIKEVEEDAQSRRGSEQYVGGSKRNSTTSLYSTTSSVRQSLLSPLLDIPLEDIQSEKELHRLTTRQLQSILEIRGVNVNWQQPRVHLLKEVKAVWEKERAQAALEAEQELDEVEEERPLQLQDFQREEDLRSLSIEQMRSILQQHGLSNRGEERTEMFIRLKKLWRELHPGN